MPRLGGERMRSQEEYALSRLKYLLGNPTPLERKRSRFTIQIVNDIIRGHALCIKKAVKVRKRHARILRE